MTIFSSRQSSIIGLVFDPRLARSNVLVHAVAADGSMNVLGSSAVSDEGSFKTQISTDSSGLMWVVTNSSTTSSSSASLASPPANGPRAERVSTSAASTLVSGVGYSAFAFGSSPATRVVISPWSTLVAKLAIKLNGSPTPESVHLIQGLVADALGFFDQASPFTWATAGSFGVPLEERIQTLYAAELERIAEGSAACRTAKDRLLCGLGLLVDDVLFTKQSDAIVMSSRAGLWGRWLAAAQAQARVHSSGNSSPGLWLWSQRAGVGLPVQAADVRALVGVSDANRLADLSRLMRNNINAVGDADSRGSVAQGLEVLQADMGRQVSELSGAMEFVVLLARVGDFANRLGLRLSDAPGLRCTREPVQEGVVRCSQVLGKFDIAMVTLAPHSEEANRLRYRLEVANSSTGAVHSSAQGVMSMSALKLVLVNRAELRVLGDLPPFPGQSEDEDNVSLDLLLTVSGAGLGGQVSARGEGRVAVDQVAGRSRTEVTALQLTASDSGDSEGQGLTLNGQVRLVNPQLELTGPLTLIQRMNAQGGRESLTQIQARVFDVARQVPLFDSRLRFARLGRGNAVDQSVEASGTVVLPGQPALGFGFWRAAYSDLLNSSLLTVPFGTSSVAQIKPPINQWLDVRLNQGPRSVAVSVFESGRPDATLLESAHADVQALFEPRMYLFTAQGVGGTGLMNSGVPLSVMGRVAGRLNARRGVLEYKDGRFESLQ